MFFLNSNINVNDIIESSLHAPIYQYTVTGKIHPALGKAIQLNGKSIAVFKYKSKIVAMDELCPHMGGPLHLGDIEDLDGKVCVSCPWHEWKFKLENGKPLSNRFPKEHAIHDHALKMYEVQLDMEGTIYIGFNSISPKVFQEPLWF